MPEYSIERKESTLSKLLNPDRYSVAKISAMEGVSEQTQYAWRNKAMQ